MSDLADLALSLTVVYVKHTARGWKVALIPASALDIGQMEIEVTEEAALGLTPGEKIYLERS